MLNRNRPLEGQVAVVTGATRGVGKGIALALGEAGASVYATRRSLEAARQTGWGPFRKPPTKSPSAAANASRSSAKMGTTPV